MRFINKAFLVSLVVVTLLIVVSVVGLIKEISYTDDFKIKYDLEKEYSLGTLGKYEFIKAEIAGRKYDPKSPITLYIPVRVKLNKDYSVLEESFNYAKVLAENNVDIADFGVDVLINESYKYPIYKRECSFVTTGYSSNSTKLGYNNCDNVIVGHEDKWRYKWIPLSSYNFKKDAYVVLCFWYKRNIELGGFNVDIIPKINSFSFSELAWWNASSTYRRNITSGSSLIVAVNGSHSYFDLDGDGNQEGIYAVPYSNQDAYVYYNDDSDAFNANDTTELCLYDSVNNRTSCPNTPNGLVSYFPLDDPSGKPYDFISDCSANNINGADFTYQVGGVSYYSINFTDDGSADYFQIEDCLPVDVFSDTNDYTISFWFNMVDWNGNGLAEANRDSGHFWYTGNTDNKLYYSWQDTTPTQNERELEAGLFANRWYLLTMTWDADGNTIHYVNGTEVDSFTSPDNLRELDDRVRFGYSSLKKEDNDMLGRIDDIRIYERVLSSTEVQELYDMKDLVLGDQETDAGGGGSDPAWEDIQENTADPQTYSTGSYNYGFQVNFTDGDGMQNVTFFHNISGSLVGYNCSQDGDFFYYNITSAPAGVINYNFVGYDTLDNSNSSDYNTFTINKASRTMNTGLSYGGEGTYPHDDAVTCTARSDEDGSITTDGTTYLYRNGTDVTSAERSVVLTYPAGSWNETCLITGGSNYTDAQETKFLNITVADANLTMVTSDDDWIIFQNDTADVNCSGDAEWVYYMNGTSLGTNTTTHSQRFMENYTHNFTCELTDYQNYTASVENSLIVLGGYYNTVNETYTPNVTENTDQYFEIIVNATYMFDLDATFYYNDTSYAVTETTESLGSNTTQYVFSRTHSIPNVTATEDVEFNFTIDYEFMNNTVVTDGTNHDQTINDFGLTNCSAGNIVLTFNFYQETNQTAEANVTFEATFWDQENPTDNTSFDITLDDTSYNFCLTPNFTSRSFDMDATYYKGDYEYRNWFLDNITLSNTSQTINMYIVSNNEASGITLHVQDQNGNDVTDALIQVQRYYMDLGEYKTVTIGKTDDNGDSYIYLIPYDVWYKFIIVEDGEVTATIPALQVKDSSMTFTTQETSLMELFEYWENIAYSCSEDTTTLNFTCSVIDTSGLLTTSYLKVEKILPITNEVICDKTGTTSITCSNVNSTANQYYYELYVDLDSDRYLLDSGYLDSRVLDTPYGVDGLVLSAILIGSVGGIGLWNPAVAIIVTLTTLGIAMYMNLVVIKFATLISLAVVGLIIMIKMRS